MKKGLGAIVGILLFSACNLQPKTSTIEETVPVVEPRGVIRGELDSRRQKADHQEASAAIAKAKEKLKQFDKEKAYK